MRRLLPGMTPFALERYVLAHLYFDRRGLIVAEDDDGIPIGFAHAGFGPTDDHSRIGTEHGITCMVMVEPREGSEGIARELIERSEIYLRDCGAKRLHAGGIEGVNPFYHGVYGGTLSPGVLASHAALLEPLEAAGYRRTGSYLVMELPMISFRAPADRRLMEHRRGYEIDAAWDPKPASWWDACVWGEFDRTRFTLRPRRSSDACARVDYWHIEPLASSWGVRAAGLVELQVDESLRRQGLATYFVIETMRRMRDHGVHLIETQVPADNEAAVGTFRRIGFEVVDEALLLEK